jgi:hypothetical protein
MGADELAAVIRRRFPRADASLEADLAACEEAAWGETVPPRQALKLIQSLHGHYEGLKDAARPEKQRSNRAAQSEKIQSKPQERAL